MHKKLFALALLATSAVHANSAAPFDTWLAEFRRDAAAQGISAATLDAALSGVKPAERVVSLDRKQPEFLQTFDDYLGRRVTSGRVSQGRALLQTHASLFAELEQRYGVPASVLVAFWGLETHYGTVKGNLNIPASLATLAYDGRRSAFFRSQLLDALHIIDAGHVRAADMTGSWAGAMGHMQFMPSTFRAYAVDGDGNGRIDLWGSIPDAMHSAANYLSRAGWKAKQPAAIEVRMPQNFDWRQARAGYRLPLAEWIALGVLPADGGALPQASERAAVVLPQGWEGPAFMVFDNFDVVMQWNRSQNYALAVAHLAQQLAGGHALVAKAPSGALSTAQLTGLQRALNELGFNAGEPDGLLGPRTQMAIRRYQAMHQLPVDGYPAPTVMAHVEQTHADARNRLTLAPAPGFAEGAER
jgi:membrane-bound lytic murein transglycosylase B